jgi:hypothetical protein
MDNTILHRRRLVVFTLAVALVLAVSIVVLPKASSAEAPEPVDPTPFELEGICPFPMLVEQSGKGKFIELPGDRFILTSPGLRVTLTNLDEPTNQATYVITGAFHVRELANRDLVVATGRNILFDPSFGMFLTIGRFTFEANEDGSITRPTGKGRMVDVCARLA